MAHHKSALKRIRTAEKARLVNRTYVKSMRRSIKTLLSIEKKDEAESLLKETTSLLDRLARRNIIHKNKAANQKSRLTKHVNALN
jgi:small subunit ribosomal protein S20